MIDRTVATGNAFHRAQAELNTWCVKTYGIEPSDPEIDGDQIIDGVLGGCGISPGMSAEQFDDIMMQR